MGIIQKNNLEKYQITHRSWQGIPSMDIDQNGTLYASWYSGGTGEGTDNYAILQNSTDNGLSFNHPLAIVSPKENTRAYDPSVFTDPFGRVHWLWAQSNGMYDGSCGVWDCIVNNESFTEPKRICDGIMMNKPTVLSNGSWLLPVSLWDMNPYFKKPGDIEVDKNKVRAGSYAVISNDNGTSYNIQGLAHPDQPSCDEHMIIEKGDGSLWMLIRVKYGIAESFSYDTGKTWSPSKPSSIASPVSRFFIRRMPSGRLLLINHHKFIDNENIHLRRNNLTAMLSDDDGKTWPHQLLLDERNSVSYPDAAIRPNGEITVIYDRDRYGVSEILTARITEDEIIAGTISDPKSYLKNIISSIHPLL